ncbi:unannotated protein [freshwater metagenome]|uniref:Unannotated protein n=1 Tax=freshwater metagenome TaxID=449393 RepID=A0A6J6J5C8_9ZZZZ
MTSRQSRSVGSRSGMTLLHFAQVEPMIRAPRSMCWTCFLTHQATSTWVTLRRMPSEMLSLAIGCSRATTLCTQLGGTHSACLQKTLPSSADQTQLSGRTKTSNNKRFPCVATHVPSTGIEFSTRVILSTTSGPSGSSCKCMSVAWPIAKTAPLTGAQPAKPFSQTSRSLVDCASVAIQQSPRKS